MVENGNFEYGNALFHSDYSYSFNTLPGKYVVTDDASQFGADVYDHSFCESSTGYATNKKFLLVNGLASMSAGSSAVIWSQKISGLKGGSEYRFCANFKNLPQCSFDALPKVTVKLSTGVSRTVTIDTDPEDECKWKLVSFCFEAEEEVTVKILLNEDALGDGNDLAIDDISVQELGDPMLSTTVMHQWNTQSVVASINTLFDPDDDYLPYDPAECDLPWYWFVYTLSNGNRINWSAPYGLGNFVGSVRYNPISLGPSWYLTTDFPGFTFALGKMYVVGMITRRCCEECIDDGWTAHVVNINSNPFGGIIPFAKDLPVPDAKDSYSALEDTFIKRGGSKPQDVTYSRSVEEEKGLIINEKDFHRIKEFVKEFEASVAYKQLRSNYELKPSEKK